MDPDGARFLQEFRSIELSIEKAVSSLGSSAALLTRRLMEAAAAIPSGADLQLRRELTAARIRPTLQSHLSELGRNLEPLLQASEELESTWQRSRQVWSGEAKVRPEVVERVRDAMRRQQVAAREKGYKTTRAQSESMKELAAELSLVEAEDIVELQHRVMGAFESIEAVAGLAVGVLEDALGHRD